MTATISCDNDIGDGHGTDPQDVAVDDTGAGTVAIQPPDAGFTAGSFSYVLSVKPASGDEVKSEPVAVTVEAAAAPQPSLETDAQSPQPANAAFNLTVSIQN